MNKKVKIFGFILIISLFGLLILKSWGEPVSELEKSNIETLDQNDFSLILGSSWKNKKDGKSSEISFYIDGLKDTKGFFKDFDIIFNVTESPLNSNLKVSINVNSIYTENEYRDEALMGEEFFNSEIYPVIEFYSNNIIKSKSNHNTTGELNMMGKGKELSFPFEFKGMTIDKDSNKIAIFEGAFEIDRTDFGMETVTSVGDEVSIKFYCELYKF